MDLFAWFVIGSVAWVLLMVLVLAFMAGATRGSMPTPGDREPVKARARAQLELDARFRRRQAVRRD